MNDKIHKNLFANIVLVAGCWILVKPTVFAEFYHQSVTRMQSQKWFFCR